LDIAETPVALENTQCGMVVLDCVLIGGNELTVVAYQ